MNKTVSYGSNTVRNKLAIGVAVRVSVRGFMLGVWFE